MSALALLLAAAAVLTSPALALAQALQQEVEAVVRQANLGPAKVAVVVQDADTGETLAEINAASPMIPASNMKLLTTGAAIIALGAEHRFQTELQRDGDRLVVVGSGDPAFGDPVLLREMGIDVEAFFGQWIDAIRETGGGPIRELVIDDSIFEPPAPHPTWPRDQLNRWYCAEVDGLNFFTNVVHVFARPTATDSGPSIEIEPKAPWLTPQNRARSVSSGANTVWVSRSLTSNDMTLHGEVRAAMTVPIEVAVHDPAMVFARMFADRIEAAGLGSPKVRRLAHDDQPIPATSIAVVATPIETILRRCNTDSHNLYAECLLKRLGAIITGQPGSWSNGAAVLRMVIADVLGPGAVGSPGSLAIADGSGMSRANRVTASLLAAWLRALAANPVAGPILWQSLPRASLDGTLASRFRNRSLEHAVRAKSGYLDQVSCLSGYVGDPTAGGSAVVFSVLVNDIPAGVPIRRVKDMHEKIVLLVDEFLTTGLAEAAGESR